MRYSALFFKVLQDLRASYWLIPTVLVIFALIVVQVTLYLDRTPDLLPFWLPDFLTNTQADGARSTLGVIAQSVIGVTGVMFSTTIVAVSFAAGNFGPRLIGNFMKDRGNQWSLGIMIAAFVYAVFILRAVQSPSDDGGAIELFVPHLSIILSFVMLLVSVLTMIYFVHHIPETINVSNITASIGHSLISAIKLRIQKEDDETDFELPDRDPDRLCLAPKSGYIQALDVDRLRRLTKEHKLIVEIPRELDAFMTPSRSLLRIWGETEEGCDDDVLDLLRDCFAIGPSRVGHKNLFFMVDKLVEMIARALSPGTNDPFTAQNCLNWLQAALTTALTHEGGLKPVLGGRVHEPDISFEALVTRGFGQSLPYVKSDPLVSKHLIGLIKELRDLSGDDIDHLRLFRELENALNKENSTDWNLS